MRGFDWLYENAGRLKKGAFVASGLGVALSTVIGKVSSTTSWIANLSAIVFGGGVYSSLKNMEIAETTRKKQQEIVSMGQRLSLQNYPYPGRPTLTDVLRELHNHAPHEITQKIQEVEVELQNYIPAVRRSAYINLAAQSFFAITTVCINAIANAENGHWRLTAKDWSNLIVVFLAISAQYGIHTIYAAHNLRQVSNDTDELHSKLTQAQGLTLLCEGI